MNIICRYMHPIVNKESITVALKAEENISEILAGIYPYMEKCTLSVNGASSPCTIINYSGSRKSIVFMVVMKRNKQIDDVMMNSHERDISIALSAGEEAVESEMADKRYVDRIRGKIGKLSKIMYLSVAEAEQTLMQFYGSKIHWATCTVNQAEEFDGMLTMFAISEGYELDTADRDTIDAYKRIARKKNICVICRARAYRTIETMSLCYKHFNECKEKGLTTIKEKYIL